MQKRHALSFITITVLLDTVDFDVIVPVLTEFLVLIGDVSLSDASALSSYLIFIYAVTNFMFAPMLGNLSEAYERKPLLVLSLCPRRRLPTVGFRHGTVDVVLAPTAYGNYQRHICESQCTDCRCQYAGR